VVVRRYKEILARDPHDERILRGLVGLYQRYRTLATLEAEYRARLDAGEDWATLVVLARLPRSSRAETTALWKRALAAKPDDAAGWLAAGDAATTEPAAARDLYRRAAKLVTEPGRKRVALTKLVGAARLVGDVATVDQGYAELIALAPKDGELWLDRGNAQLGAKQFEAAEVSFAAAEPLLRSYPEHRLSAMMNRGIALEGLGRTEAAIAELERTLDQVPRGYYLGQELVLRIVDIERRHDQLAAAIARLETRWPARSRGYFEWATLGDLYSETHDDDRALGAYESAVAKSPTEVSTQSKLIALLDKLHPDQALARHEAAARVAPGDVELQIGLAKRYYPTQPAKAFATLVGLARRMKGMVNVHSKLAELYEEWHEVGRAIPEYEAIATLEPDDPDHALVLGEAYWRAGDTANALGAWDRLDKIGTAVSLRRHGEELALHEQWDGAVAAYTKSVAIDGTNVDTLYGRARAHDALRHAPAAIEDARRAVALTGYATHADGTRTRQLLVRIFGHAYSRGDHAGLETALVHWRFALDHGDVTAGYLLAAHHARIQSHQLHDVLVELYRLVPTDDSLGIALSRSFERRGDFARARRELQQVARRTPARADEMNKLIALVESDRERYEEEIRREEEGGGSRGATGRPDLVGRARLGMRLELGADVREASGALFGFGLYTTTRQGRGTAIAVRLDWTKRNDEIEELDTFALAGGITTRILDTRKFELAIGVGPRLELRYHRNSITAWNRGALAGDVTLELLPRAIPATLGLRFDQVFTDDAKSSALLVELGFEVR
jgi:tetratricopeptide (TPR) repeat protein